MGSLSLTAHGYINNTELTTYRSCAMPVIRNTRSPTRDSPPGPTSQLATGSNNSSVRSPQDCPVGFFVMSFTDAYGFLPQEDGGKTRGVQGLILVLICFPVSPTKSPRRKNVSPSSASDCGTASGAVRISVPPPMIFERTVPHKRGTRVKKSVGRPFPLYHPRSWPPRVQIATKRSPIARSPDRILVSKSIRGGSVGGKKAVRLFSSGQRTSINVRYVSVTNVIRGPGIHRRGMDRRPSRFQRI